MPDWLLPLLFAPFAGSVLGVLIRRLPEGRPVMLARSACESCGRRLGGIEMTPLLAHAALGGRCRTCRAPICAMHWQVEVAAIAPAALAGIVHGGAADPAALWADCVLGWVLLALAWIDWRHGRLPDALTLPLLLLGLLATWWLEPAALTAHAIGAVAGYALFRSVAAVYRFWRGRDGLGRGDAKLLAAAGAWVGWEGLDEVVLFGAVATIGVALWRSHRQSLSSQTSVPFGPGLGLATFIVRLQVVSEHGPPLLGWAGG